MSRKMVFRHVSQKGDLLHPELLQIATRSRKISTLFVWMMAVLRIEVHHPPPINQCVNPRLSATVRTALSDFIPLMNSLANGQGGPEVNKGLMPRVGPVPSGGRERRKGGRSGALRDRPTAVAWCFDGQRRSTVWSCAGPREGINPIVAQIPTLASVPGAQLFDDATQDEDCSTPIGKGLSSLWLCAGPEEIAFGVGVSAPMHRLHRRNRAKAES
jgi:hypothetical protein